MGTSALWAMDTTLENETGMKPSVPLLLLHWLTELFTLQGLLSLDPQADIPWRIGLVLVLLPLCLACVTSLTIILNLLNPYICVMRKLRGLAE